MGSTHASDTAVQITLEKCHHLITLAKNIRPKEMSEDIDEIIESTTGALDYEDE